VRAGEENVGKGMKRKKVESGKGETGVSATRGKVAFWRGGRWTFDTPDTQKTITSAD